jgi:hypothetical protein
MRTQDVEYDDVDEYKEPIIIPAKKLQNTLKDISTTKGRVTEVESNGHWIRYYCDNGQLMTADKRHGDIDIKEDVNYKESFDSSLLVKLQKILGLSQNVKVFITEGCPLKFELNIGSLGTICIYIKSREIVDRESTVGDEESD